MIRGLLGRCLDKKTNRDTTGYRKTEHDLKYRYSYLAKLIGNPGAARAIGTAMGSNAMAIIIPCHRVLPAKGGLGGWSGPFGWKQRLLKHEGIKNLTILPCRS